MTHVAMTDHGNMFGAAEFHRQAKEDGITPVIGIEAYVAPGDGGTTPTASCGASRTRSETTSPPPAPTCTRRSGPGTTRACTTSSSSRAAPTPRAGSSSGPGWTRSSSPSTPQGLMASTGCPSGEVQTRLRLGQVDEALKAAARVPGHLRQGELLPRADGPRPRHRDAGSATACSRSPGSSTSRRSSPTTPTTRREQDAQAHDLLLCIQTGKTLADADRFKFDGTGYYIKSAAGDVRASTTATSGRRAAATRSC